MQALFYSLILVPLVSGDFVINTPVETTFGSWKPWDYCPPQTYIVSMDVRTAKMAVASRTVPDNLGLIDVVFQCSSPASDTPESFIFTKVGGVTSSVAGYGNISISSDLPSGPIVYPYPLATACEGVAIGVQVISEEEQISLDNSAANNLRLYCSGLVDNVPAYVEGYGDYLGEWSDPQHCRGRQALCGVQTQSQDIDDEGKLIN